MARIGRSDEGSLGEETLAVTLRVLAIAEEEALAAATWYEDRQLGLGQDFLDRYAKALEGIEIQPERFGRLETIRSRRQIRRCLLSRFPYAIIFEVLANEIVVLAVPHLHRRPNYWRRRSV